MIGGRTIKQIRRYLDVQLNKEDTEIYLDTDDYETIVDALETLEKQEKELKHLRNLVEYSKDFNCTIEQAEKDLMVKKKK